MNSRQLTAHGTCRMKPLVQFPLSGFLVVWIGCSLVVPKETLYLRAAQNLARQALRIRGPRLGRGATNMSSPSIGKACCKGGRTNRTFTAERRCRSDVIPAF